MRHTKKIIAMITTTCIMASMPTAHAQIPTIDASSIAQIKNTISQIQEDVRIGQQIYSAGQQIYSSIGQPGKFSLSNIVNYAQLFGSTGPGMVLLENFGLTSDEFNVISNLGKDAALGQFNASNFSGNNFQGAVNNIQTMFYTSGAASLIQRDNIMATRQAAARQASTQGYAMALTQRSQTATQQQQTQALQGYVESAQTQRDDIRANSIIEIARYQQGQQMLALLSAQLQMMAAQNISQDGSMSMATQGVQQ